MLSHGVRRAGLRRHRSGLRRQRPAGCVLGIQLESVGCGRGILMVEEAGGRVSDMNGAARSVRGPHLLADNGRCMSRCSRSSGIFSLTMSNTPWYRCPPVPLGLAASGISSQDPGVRQVVGATSARMRRRRKQLAAILSQFLYFQPYKMVPSKLHAHCRPDSSQARRRRAVG